MNELRSKDEKKCLVGHILRDECLSRMMIEKKYVGRRLRGRKKMTMVEEIKSRKKLQMDKKKS